MADRATALVVEDDPASRTALVEIVKREGYDVSAAPSLAEAREQLSKGKPALVLVDISLPDGNGLDLLGDIGQTDPTEVVFITGQATVDTVVTALRRGALDYLTKPVEVDRLRQILRDVAKSWAGANARAESLESAQRTGVFGRLWGRSPQMMRLYKQIMRVAPTRATVLLQGETGTGKEVVSQSIHEMSDRRDEPFIPLNCGAVSGTLIESELFGHEKGSFTGASRRHIGVFERAQQGTLFLDEITEMPLDLQVKLLRVLETRTFQRVGGESSITSDARLIAATNRAPEEAVREGKLREDLFYRLRVFPVQLPPLREREGDVRLLAERFLNGLCIEHGLEKAFSEDALQWLEEQPWPGNVRELRNLVFRSFILADAEVQVDDLRLVDVEDEGSSSAPPTKAASGDEIVVRVGTSIAEVEKELILATLERFQGNKNKAARVLGISVKTLYSRLNVYNAAK